MSEKIFISHASEDKEAIARPLALRLRRRGYDVWYDEFSLGLGDSLKASIDKGLTETHFGVVILSKSFFAKRWPKEELDGLAAKEVSEKRKLILPVWHELDFNVVCQHSPTLAGKVAISTSNTISEIAKRIANTIESEKLNWVTPIVDESDDERRRLLNSISSGTMKELGAFVDGPKFCLVAFDMAWPSDEADKLRDRMSDMLEGDFKLKKIGGDRLPKKNKDG